MGRQQCPLLEGEGVSLEVIISLFHVLFSWRFKGSMKFIYAPDFTPACGRQGF
jgi:hypothetical protein